MTAPRLIAIVSLTTGLLAAPLAAEAQATRVYRVALVLTTSPVAEMAGPEPIHPLVRTFLRELRALGYVEGQNLVLERRSAEGSPDRYPAIMAELAGLNVDVIVTVGDAMARAAKQATNAIPIVMATSADPVATRVVASLARPGGNDQRLVELAAISRLPAMYPDREYVKAGGLMSYGVSLSDLFRRAVTYVDKILKGAKPADLPVQQPTKFDLVVNLKTAKVLGLTIVRTRAGG